METITKNDALAQHLGIIAGTCRKRTEGILAARGRNLRPCEVDELVDEATQRVWLLLEDHIDARYTEKLCCQAAVFAVFDVLHGSRIAGGLGDGTRIRTEERHTETDLNFETIADRMSTRYAGPSYDELLEVLDDRERIIAESLAFGVKRTVIAETIGISTRQLRNVTNAIGEKLFPLLMS